MRLVVDANIALKWFIPETGSADAAALRFADQLIAPDLIIAECCNALWKKVRRGELDQDAALLAARGLILAQIELTSMRTLAPAATSLAVRLDHPAYDCFYLALAQVESCALATADDRLARKAAAAGLRSFPEILTLAEAARRMVS